MEPGHRLMQERIKKLNELRKLGINPYPNTYKQTHHAKEILEKYAKLKPEEKTGVKASIAGRIVSLRSMGKIAFMHVLDQSGKIQVFMNTDTKNFELLKYYDLGDWIGVTGEIFATKTGEISIKGEKFEMLSKSLRPLPEKYHGLQDIELKYRQRYVDLFANPESRDVFIKRSIIIKKIKEILEKNSFLEVETPTLQTIYGGANARPFTTYHNELKMTLYLRISNELYLKRLLVGGFEKVYEFVKDFRNEGIDSTHYPEFTQVEWYEAYHDYNRGMELFETIYEECVKAVNNNKTLINYQGTMIDFKKPWKRIKMVDAIKQYAKIDVTDMSTEQLLTYCRKEGIEVKSELWGMLVQSIFEAKCEKHLVQPTFVIDYPVETTPLCKPSKEDNRFVERFEAYANCWELGNAYSELNDPILQKKFLQEQVERGRGGEEETHPMDEDFVTAVEYGMPPASGVGLGVDRMVMLLTNSKSIRDVIFFPTLRKKED